jgi:hypothetical protein
LGRYPTSATIARLWRRLEASVESPDLLSLYDRLAGLAAEAVESLERDCEVVDCGPLMEAVRVRVEEVSARVLEDPYGYYDYFKELASSLASCASQVRLARISYQALLVGGSVAVALTSIAILSSASTAAGLLALLTASILAMAGALLAFYRISQPLALAGALLALAARPPTLEASILAAAGASIAASIAFRKAPLRGPCSRLLS